jgi:Tripartite tricarboxylate transporter family receptor
MIGRHSTVGDFVPGYEASAVGGFGAPKGTPVEIIQKLNVEINAGLADPDVRSRYAALGNVPNPGSPADFGKLIVAETEKWATARSPRERRLEDQTTDAMGTAVLETRFRGCSQA